MSRPPRDYAFKRLGAELSNWGRWGEHDEIGTVNLITPAVRRAAAALVRTGTLFDLGMPFDANGPQVGTGRSNPVHAMTLLPSDGALFDDGLIISDDMVTMPLQCATQWDGLAHAGYDGLLYNGVPAAAITASRGATRLGLDQIVPRLIGRGVLLDIARLKGVDRLAPNEAVTADDLEAAARAQGVTVRAGDVVLFRTGWYRHFLEGDFARYVGWESAGLDLSTCRWLHEHDVAAVAGDVFAIEVAAAAGATRPAALEGTVVEGKEEGTSLPVHMVLIRDMGMTLGEMFNLEDLADHCAGDGTWEFLFSGIGLKITGSVGSPLTPVVLK